VEKSSYDDDDEAKKYLHDARMALGAGEANISTQKLLLSEVIGELKSVSVMMSSTLQLATAASARNNNNNRLSMAALGEAYELQTADSHRVCSPAAVTVDKDDNDYYEGYNKNDDTCTTEVCKRTLFSKDS